MGSQGARPATNSFVCRRSPVCTCVRARGSEVTNTGRQTDRQTEKKHVRQRGKREIFVFSPYMTSDDVTSGRLLWKVLNWNTEGNYKNGAVARQKKKKVSGVEKRGNRQVDSGSLASLCHITNSLQQSQVFFLKEPYIAVCLFPHITN